MRGATWQVLAACLVGALAFGCQTTHTEVARDNPKNEPLNVSSATPPLRAQAPSFRNLVGSIRFHVFFSLNSAEIDAVSRVELGKLRRDLNLGLKIATIRIEGYTCDLGSTEYNLELSRRRAEAVRNHLLLLGVPPEVIEIHAYGESKPWWPPKHRERNRRVEVEVDIVPVPPQMEPGTYY